jgi:tRNA pseudouridine55 synthase
LGCGGHLIALRRTAIWHFELQAAYSLPQLEQMNEQQRDAAILPLDSMLQDYPALELDATELHRMAQGQRLGKKLGLPDGKIRLYSSGNFVGIGELQGTRLAPSRLLASIAKSAAGLKSEAVDLGC